MKLMIDTNADSKEDLLAAKQLLESVLAKRGIVSQSSSSYSSQSSSDDRLQRKLAKAQAKQESAAPVMDMFGSTQSETKSEPEAVPVMDMFGSNEPSSTPDYSSSHEPEEDEPQVQILPY